MNGGNGPPDAERLVHWHLTRTVIMEQNLQLHGRDLFPIDDNPPQEENPDSNRLNRQNLEENSRPIHASGAMADRVDPNCEYFIVKCEREQGCRKTIHARIAETDEGRIPVFHCPGKCHNELEMQKLRESLEKERVRAEQERERAEQERERAERERERADRADERSVILEERITGYRQRLGDQATPSPRRVGRNLEYDGD